MTGRFISTDTQTDSDQEVDGQEQSNWWNILAKPKIVSDEKAVDKKRPLFQFFLSKREGRLRVKKIQALKSFPLFCLDSLLFCHQN